MRNENDIEIDEILKGFEMFDVDSSGKIYPLEIKEIMDIMNTNEKNPLIYEIIDSLCNEKKYKNDGITINELMNFLYSQINDNESKNGLRKMFNILSDKKTNTIPMQTFLNLSKEFHNDEGGISEKELKYLLEKTQLSNDGLTFEEFSTIMKAENKNNKKINKNEIYKKPINEKNKNKILENGIEQTIFSTPKKSEKIIQNLPPMLEKNYLDNDNSENIENGGNGEEYDSETIIKLPDGKKQIEINLNSGEIIEKNQIFQRYDDVILEKDEENYSSKEGVNSNKGSITNNNISEIENLLSSGKNSSENTDKNENGEVFVPKRYHRRYRENKISTNVNNDE